MAAMNSSGTVLKYGTASATDTLKIKDTPVIMAKRSSLETTCLSDDARTYIPGIRETAESFDFTANYEASVFEKLNKLTETQCCALQYSDNSGYTWKGKISASVNEAAVDAVLEMTISITPENVPIWVKDVSTATSYGAGDEDESGET